MRFRSTLGLFRPSRSLANVRASLCSRGPARAGASTAALLTVALVAAGCGDSTTTPAPEPPSVELASNSVAQQGEVAGPVQSATVSVANGGDGALSGLSTEVVYTDGEAEGWLVVSLDGTTAPATLTLEATPPPRPGTYRASVNVRSTSTNSFDALLVEFEVAARPFLYMIEEQDRTLRRMDPETLEIETVGPIGVDYRFGACAWNPDNQTLYATDGRGRNALLTLDLATGAATTVGIHGTDDVFSLEYYAPAQSFYAVSRIVAELPRPVFLFSPLTAFAVEVGSAGRSISAIAWDPSRETMLALSANVGADGGWLSTMDLQTGFTTIFTRTPPINSGGLTYDPVGDQFWAADSQGQIMTFDPGNNYEATIRATGQGRNNCIAYVP